MFSRISTKRSTSGFSAQIARLRRALDEADAVVIGAGAGLSTAAGFTYNGERFERYFSDFAEKYGVHDMYSGGFYSFPSQEEFWAYWSRYIFINRYLQVLAYMFRFDAKTGYYLYPEAEGSDDLKLRMNCGSTYEKNVMPRDDISLTKHGLKIPVDALNYAEFSVRMKTCEQEFKSALIF